MYFCYSLQTKSLGQPRIFAWNFGPVNKDFVRNIISHTYQLSHTGFFQALFDCCIFEKLELSSLNVQLHFDWNKPYFYRLNLLINCWSENQYSKITVIFFQDFKPQCDIRLYETKVTTKNNFNWNHFEIESSCE